MSKNRSKKSGARSQKIQYWLPALLYMGFIFVMSSFPAPEAIRKVPVIYDIKLVHLIEYGILSLLFAFALHGTTSLNKGQLFWTSVALTFLYGLTDEYHQMFVPGRSAKVIDAVTNGIGALVFQGSLWPVQKIRTK